MQKQTSIKLWESAFLVISLAAILEGTYHGFSLYLGADFSRDVENVILSVSLTLIITLGFLINSKLLRISLWKKSRVFVVLGLTVKSQT